MVKVVRIEQTGGPEVIGFADVELPAPGPGEVRLKHNVIGINFIDTYHRRGIYPVELPTGLGMEAVGVVEAVGPGVTAFKPGDRAGCFGPERGSYAEARIIAADALFPIPDDIPDDIAAAALLKGCTTEFLVERCAKVEAGWPVLVHAAAGGVGLLLVQWLKAVGATVIGTVGSPEKAELARAAGADHCILYRQEDTAKRVRALTDGAGVRVTFDGIGRATWEQSLDSTGMRGLIVSYGNADAPVPAIAPGVLATKGSLYNTRPMLYHYYLNPAERAAGAERLWAMLRSKQLSVTIGHRWAFEDAAEAHRALEARETVGSCLLIP